MASSKGLARTGKSPTAGGLDRQLTKRQSESARQAIRVGALIRGLQNHFEGKQELSPTQAAAAKTLLDRALPVLSAVEYTQHDELPTEGTLVERIDKLLQGQTGLQMVLWQNLTSKVLEKAVSVEESDRRLQPILSAHISLKRLLLERLQADLRPSELDAAPLEQVIAQ